MGFGNQTERRFYERLPSLQSFSQLKADGTDRTDRTDGCLCIFMALYVFQDAFPGVMSLTPSWHDPGAYRVEGGRFTTLVLRGSARGCGRRDCKLFPRPSLAPPKPACRWAAQSSRSFLGGPGLADRLGGRPHG